MSDKTLLQDTPRFISRLTKNTVALILAGGRGSRLMQLTDWTAKPALPFGGKFRIIDFPLSNCINSGIRRIGVITQYKAHSLIQHMQRGWSFLQGQFKEFIDLMPAQQRIEESWYKGTADAVFQNIDILREQQPEYVLILAGDHIYKMDYGRMLADHVERGADMTVSCIEVPITEAHAFGVMGVNEQQRVVSFQEKPSQPVSLPNKPDAALASMGIYLFNADFLYEHLIRDADEKGSSHDFGKDLIPYLISRYRVLAHHFSKSCVPKTIPYWRDVGTVNAYWQANMELIRIVPDLNLYDREWPIWTYQEQLPPAKFVFDDPDRCGTAIASMVSGGCIISGAKILHSLLFSDVRVDTYSHIEDSVILPRVSVGHHVTIKRAIIDRCCILPDGFQVGVNQEADKQRFHVTDQGITLVTPDMLGQKLHQVR